MSVPQNSFEGFLSSYICQDSILSKITWFKSDKDKWLNVLVSDVSPYKPTVDESLLVKLVNDKTMILLT